MPIVSPYSIDSYTRCPRYTFYSLDNKRKLSPVNTLVSNVIQASYLHFSRKEQPVTWRVVSAWAQEGMIKLSLPEEEYKKAKSILSRLSVWYDKYYLDEYVGAGLTNVPITLSLGSGYFFSDKIPILISRKKLQVFDFSESTDLSSCNGPSVYNDYVTLSRVWGFNQALSIPPAEYIRFVIGPESIKAVRINIDNLYIRKGNSILRQILQGMKDEVWYPSRSSRCESCPLKANCGI
jgi:hypothetical protein